MLLSVTNKSYNVQLLVAVAFCICTMAVSLKFPQVNSAFQSVVVEVSEPILTAVKKPGEIATSVSHSVSDYIAVYEENKSLKDELSDKQRLTRELSILEYENDSLRSLLGMVEKAEGVAVSGRIISDRKSVFSHTVITNVGSNAGVEKGHVVINQNGLVGRVLEVFGDSSRILLLSDYASRIPVKVLGANVRGIVRGNNTQNLELVFTEEAKERIEVGMVVVTTGIDGMFPEGLPVGVVEKTGKYIFIKPDVDFSRLSIVSIQKQPIKGIL